MTQDATTATAHVSYKGATFTLTFAKAGAMGGHITAKESNGSMCDEDLGAMGTMPGPDGGLVGADGGPVAGDGGLGSSGGDGGSTRVGSDGGAGGKSGQSSGCGCGVMDEEPGNVAAAFALGLMATAFVRKRRD
jgi:MYXO-CTERM domain-containing protein